MASKKLILGIIGVAAVGYYFYDKNKKEGGSSVPSISSGDNKTQRWLSDAEALAYLAANPDVAQAYGAGNIQGGKDHYYFAGYAENRPMA